MRKIYIIEKVKKFEKCSVTIDVKQKNIEKK